MSRWFRMYDDLLDDPKVQRLSPDLFKAWVNLLCLASRNGGIIPPIEDAAFALRMNELQAQAVIGVLADRGLIDSVYDRHIPHNWDKRQYKSDKDGTSAERQARKRERDKYKSHEPVTRDVTVQSRPPETETDTDTNNEDKSSLSSGDGDFEKFMAEYPERDAYPDTDGARAAFNAYISAGGSVANLLIAAAAYRKWVIDNGKHRTKYVKQAAKWLSGNWGEWLPKAKAVVSVSSVQIVEGSPEWTAWKAAKGGRMAAFDLRSPDGRPTGKTGCYQPTQWPPGHEAAA